MASRIKASRLNATLTLVLLPALVGACALQATAMSLSDATNNSIVAEMRMPPLVMGMADEIIDRLFWRGVILIGLLILGLGLLRRVQQRIVGT